jgi:hypothetical protein
MKGYEWVMAQIRQRGGTVVYPVELPSREELFYEGKSVLYSVSCKLSILGISLLRGWHWGEKRRKKEKQNKKKTMN